MSDLIIPNHLGFIIDGNRRWAKEHGVPTYEGHLAGYKTTMKILTKALEMGVKYGTVYAFSTENWMRDKDEIKKLMNLMLQLLVRDLPIIQEKNVKLVILGSRERLDKKIVESISKAEAATANNTGGTLAVCWNYGGQLEIVDAVKKIIKSGKTADDVTIDLISQNLYSPELPPIDMIVRTSGEMRLSNFMTWRSAYSEMHFIDKMWPDMKKQDLVDIFKEYGKRSRRFGA